jgi:poly-gamma-glutamate synthesis protein (capsule biosynthesis protein)
LADAFRQLIDSRPAEFAWAEVGAADVTAGFDPTLPLGHWVFAAVAPFYTIPDEVEYADIVSAWNGAAKGPFAGRPFLFSQETADALESQFGHRPIGAQLVDSAELLDAAWAARPAWAIVPFEALEPRWKVLRVDGLSPLDTMTGVTALARATAYAMEISGITYPGEEVARVLQSADIVHVSNEVSFASDCPYPDPARQEGPIRFCSDDRYIELLEFIGANVIELTGNHNNDWGTAAFDRTLAMYQQRGWGTFGGGANALQASQPLTVTHNGNTIGLMGCNPVGPRFAWATVDSPGAAYCTMQSLAASVTELAAQVDVVAVGIQYREHYTYAATSQQRTDFLALSAAGADIVSGSQGHHAQGFAFPAGGGSIVHFGLGNLFFDQMDKLGTRQTFIDRHVIYAGRLIATDLWTGLIENWARPRAMTPIERADLLRSVFAASDW